ncbi:MAG: beta-N-acetylglucosaminidase [Capnocytophaga sp.]|nr:beta-N-acetylglucosaminidase [Capnocytophaga sp.]
MRKIIIITALFLFVLAQIKANESIFNPVPKQVKLQGSTFFPQKVKIYAKDKQLYTLLEEILQQKSQKQGTFEVFVGNKNEKSLKKFANKVPNQKEGYYLRIDKGKIYIIGNDERGTYYGLRTFEQLCQGSELPLGEIIDYPDLEHRGVVEGFYGTPWNHEKRLRQIAFYGENKLNTYIYGPKDDPYHSSPNWRQPYPAQEAKQLQELVQKAKENQVDFVWAIHPGKDIQWNEADRKHLLRKFEDMYQLGVRAFAVFFDDISGEGTNPQKQAELLNFLHTEFVEKKGDVNPLIMCPTEYNKSWSNPEKKYLETLGTVLHPSVHIMWTGNKVVADIDKATMEWINAKIKRKAYIWWNFPVSDYVRNHMLLGATYGNTNDIKNDMSGFVSNPMEHPEASMIAIYGVADYTWNIATYDPEQAWRKAIARIMPQNQAALLTFAQHNSDLGANGHQYRRVESVAFAPFAKEFLENLSKDTNPQTKRIEKEFKDIISASEQLLNTKENPYLIEELRPWLLQFQLTGKKGQKVIELYEILQQKKYTNFKNEYSNLQNIQKQQFDIDQMYNQNPYQPGMRVATLVIEPLIAETLKYMVEKYNKDTGETLQLTLNFNPNVLITNIEQIKHQPLLQKGQGVRISPALEYISLKKGDFLGIQLEKTLNIKNIFVDLGGVTNIEKGKIQISDDGTSWKDLSGSFRNSRWSNSTSLDKVKYVRFINNANEPFQIQLKQFEIVAE